MLSLFDFIQTSSLTHAVEYIIIYTIHPWNSDDIVGYLRWSTRVEHHNFAYPYSPVLLPDSELPQYFATFFGEPSFAVPCVYKSRILLITHYGHVNLGDKNNVALPQKENFWFLPRSWGFQHHLVLHHSVHLLHLCRSILFEHFHSSSSDVYLKVACKL